MTNSTAPRRRPLLWAPVLALVALAGGLLPAAGAQAASLRVQGDALVYEAAPGEANYVVVNDRFAGPGTVDVRSSEGPGGMGGATPMTLGPGCLPDALGEEDTARCSIVGVHVMRIALGDRADGFSALLDTVQDQVGAVGAQVSAGSGADDVSIESLAGRSDVAGGTGNDTLAGGSANDLLRGEDGSDELEGWEGDDRLEGGAGNDWFDNFARKLGPGTAEPGSDYIDGGGGRDTMAYGKAGHHSVTLDGLANDGRPGEQDNVSPSVEVVAAGGAGNAFVGNGAANTFVIAGGTLKGRGGNDRLKVDGGTAYGGGGDDRLFATGTRKSRLVGGGGDDRLRSAGADVCTVGTHDRLDGGSGRDRAVVNRNDRLRRIERRRVIAPPEGLPPGLDPCSQPTSGGGT